MGIVLNIALAVLSLSQTSYALYGFDLIAYDPICAYACARSLGSFMLSCSTMGMTGEGMEGSVPTTDPDCYATDTSYLTTLAYCVNASCVPEGVMDSTLNDFWEGPAIANPASAMTSSEVLASPKWTYAQTLYSISKMPMMTINTGEMLNYTALVNSSTYSLQAGTLKSVYHEEEIHTKYGVALLVAGFALPIVMTLLLRLPYMTKLNDIASPFLTIPPILDFHSEDAIVRRLGFAPTAGQAIYIATMTILTIIFCCINYENVQPHAWYSSTYTEIMAYAMWRTGLLGFAILPLVILFAGRNNILLWLSNWSHSTFMVLHLWVAWIFGILVLVHSILALVLYTATDSFSSNESMSYWIWGIVGTLTTVILLVASGTSIRSWSYEFFLALHVIMAVLTIVGCWYHIFYLDFGWSCGDLEWIFAAIGVWGFDRVVRALRVLKAGLRSAQVTDIGAGYVRVDVKGIRWHIKPGMHIYTFFPMLHPLRPWENHPFSPIATHVLDGPPKAPVTFPEDEETPNETDVEKQAILGSAPLSNHSSDYTPGISFLIKKGKGMTKALAARANVLTLLDGPYPSHQVESVLGCDRVILMGGGIGITTLLSYAAMHPNVKLYWSLKREAECLVSALSVPLDTIPEKEIRLNERLNVLDIIQHEASLGSKKIGVVVCGPAGMHNDVRSAVAEIGRMTDVRFEVVVDSYSF